MHLGLYTSCARNNILGASPLDPSVLLPSAVAAGKPACIEPASGNKLAACVDHAQSARVQAAGLSATRFRHRHRHIPELTSGFNS